MKKAYILLVHKNPTQVSRLMRTLQDGSSFFFVHIDKKEDPGKFRELFPDRNVTEVESVVTNWGEFNIVEAVLNGLRSVRSTGIEFDRIILLSGQDYPIKSNKIINEFLKSSPYKIFIEHFNLPNHAKWQPNGGLYRVTKYFRGLKVSQRLLAKTMNFLATLMPALGRKLPGRMKAYAGSTWWIIDMAGLNYILKYVQDNPAYTAFHRHTFAPDELFFQMILLNAENEQIASSISGDNLRFMNWKDAQAPHPELISRSEMPRIVASDALFARKFDIYADREILDLIDERCLRDNEEDRYSSHR